MIYVPLDEDAMKEINNLRGNDMSTKPLKKDKE